MQYYRSGDLIAARYQVVQGPHENRSLLGGMGVVYICNVLAEDLPVVLKTFKPEYLPDQAARDRFLREGTYWMDLGRHPHVVQCHGVMGLEASEEVYVMLELVVRARGRNDASLHSWLNPGEPLPVEAALLFALQAARGMQHAVDTLPGLVHRDLKPANLLVGADRLSGDVAANRLRVTDFGLAHVPQEGGDVGRTPSTRGVGGTPLYMAPEQWRREAVSTATDIYALGCILYEMVAGQHAVMGRSLAALRRAHCKGQRQPLPDGVPDEVERLVDRCLALVPGERYGSWDSVETALGKAYEAVTGKPAPAPEPASALSQAGRVASGWSRNSLGGSYLELGKVEVAVGYFEQARAAGEAEGDRALVATALDNLGNAHTRLGDAGRAIGYFEQALETAREIGDRRVEVASLRNLGDAYRLLGDARRAIGFHEQSLATAREIDDRRGKATAFGNLGSAYLQLGNARRAISYQEQALAVLREMGDRRLEGTALDSLGSAYRYLGDARRATGYHEEARQIAIEIGDTRGEANALGNLGSDHIELDDPRRAADCYQQVLVIAHEIEDQRMQGLGLMNLGIAYSDLGDATRAVEYYQQAVSIFREIGDEMNAVSVGYNLALLLVQQGRHAEALPHAQRAVQVFTQIGHTQYAQQAQQLLAQIRAALG